MNYLAHMYLSGNDAEIMVGNFVADAVKGRRMERYSEGIKLGIRLHRAIDSFTDAHPVVTEARKILHPRFHKYSGVVVDMYYDHFLVRYWDDYAAVDLKAFVQENYQILIQHFAILPARVRRFLPHMVRFDWLSSYGDIHHLDQAFKGIASRTDYESGLENAAEALTLHYNKFEMGFRQFFPELITYTQGLNLVSIKAIR